LRTSNHHSTPLESCRQLGQRFSYACFSQAYLSLKSIVPMLSRSLHHDFFKSRLHKIDLFRTLDVLLQWRALWECVSQHFKQILLLLFLIFLRHSSRCYVTQILQPFEVGNGYTADVCKQVWDDHNAFPLQNLVSSESGWTICTLKDYFCFDVLCIMHVD